MVVVEGPAGVGKTALVRRAMGVADDFRVLTATGDEWESCLAGGVVAQLMAGADGAPEPQAFQAPQAAGDPFATGVSLLEVLGQLQRGGPVAVVVDDAQWADTVSLQAMAFALRRLHRDHVLAVFVARDGPPGLPEVLRRLADGEGGVNLRLGGLDPTDLAELGSAITGHTLSRRAAQRLCAHTGGNPLHAGALLEELAESALEDVEVVLPAPTSFAMVIAARLAGCTPETVNLVQAAAVLGPRCSLGTAAAVGGVTDPAGALDEAVAAHLLDLSPPRQVAFVHPLVRAAVYGDLGPSRRVALHAGAAAILEGPTALFHRVEAALVEDAALAVGVEAHARHELARGALASGADALLVASRLTVDHSLREPLVLDALEALLGAGDVARAAVVAKDSAVAADTVRGCFLLGHLAMFGGRQDEAEALLVDAWSQWDPCQEPRLGPLVAADIAQVCAMQLRSAEAAEWARRAIDASKDPELTTVALSILVPCLGRAGRPAEAFAAVVSLPHDAPDSTDVQMEALLSSAMVRLWVDDLEHARAGFTAVVGAFRTRPACRQALVALGMLADTEYRLGAWDDSVVHGAQVVSLVEDSEQVWFRAFAHAAATWVLAVRGDFDEAEAHARAAAGAGRLMGDVTSIGCAATAAAHVAFFRGEYSSAVRAVQPMLELGDRAADDEPSVHPWRELHAEALLRLGRLEEAEIALETLEALARSRDRRSSLAHAALLRGDLEAARGHHDAARTGFEAAVGLAEEMAAPFHQARGHDAYGRYLRRRGRRRVAAAHLQRAWEGFTALGASPLARRCEQELAGCGMGPSPRPAPASVQLTVQELAVARLVSTGQTNREVAAELVVSPKTVEYHLGHVYAKLGVRSRTELAALLRDTRA